MKKLSDHEFWFIVGSQFLYGPEVLETVDADLWPEEIARLKQAAR